LGQLQVHNRIPARFRARLAGNVHSGRRPSTFRKYAEDAGYSSVEVLPLEHDLFRFYRLNP
jgi:hypothetical protein